VDLQPIAVMLQLMRPARTAGRLLGDDWLAGMDESSRRVRLGVEHFFCGPSRKGTSQKDGDPTLQGHPAAPSLGRRQKSAFAQPVNYSGRGTAIPEECEIPQKTQVAPLQITLYPGAR